MYFISFFFKIMTVRCNSQVSVDLEQVIGEEISLYEGFMGDLQKLPFQKEGIELIKVQSEAPLGEGGAPSSFSLCMAGIILHPG